MKPNGIAIINTFRTNGQTSCAGLDIVQYDKSTMLKELISEDLKLIESQEYTHITPKNTEQQEYVLFVISN